MTRPHPALLALARSETIPTIDDGDGFLASAIEHGMSGLAWEAVNRGDLRLPPNTVHRLAATDMGVVAHHHNLWEVLVRVVNDLREAGIEVVAFKGIVDEQRFFSRLGNRPCADIDLVVMDPDRIDDAISVIEPNHPLAGLARDIAERGQARAFDVWAGSAFVDLHADPLKVGAGWRHPTAWWEHTTTAEGPDGEDIRVFDLEAATVLRLLHSGRDRFRSLLTVVEADRMLAADPDLATVIELAGAEGVAAPVGVAADVIGDVLGRTYSLPHRRDWRSRLWSRWWRPQVRLRGEEGRRLNVRRSQWGLPLTMPGRFFESLAWIARTIVPPRRLFDLKHPDMTGPYAWRILVGRLLYYRRRRRSSDGGTR